MNDDDIRNLRERGGRVGGASFAQWQELLDTFKIEKVRFAIAQVKISTRSPQVSAEEVAKHLKHKLKADATTPAPKPAAAVVPEVEAKEDEDVEEEEAADDDQVETPSERPLNAPKKTDYLAIIARLGSPYVKEIAEAAGVKAQSVGYWLKHHADLVTAVPAGRSMRYKVKMADAAPPAASTPVAEASTAEAERADLIKTIDALLEPEPPATPRDLVRAAAERQTERQINPPLVLEPGTIHTAGPDTERSAAALAFTVTDEELAGDLIDIASRLIDVYADHHGFSHTFHQTHRVMRFLQPAET